MTVAESKTGSKKSASAEGEPDSGAASGSVSAEGAGTEGESFKTPDIVELASVESAGSPKMKAGPPCTEGPEAEGPKDSNSSDHWPLATGVGREEYDGLTIFSEGELGLRGLDCTLRCCLVLPLEPRWCTGAVVRGAGTGLEQRERERGRKGEGMLESRRQPFGPREPPWSCPKAVETARTVGSFRSWEEAPPVGGREAKTGSRRELEAVLVMGQRPCRESPPRLPIAPIR